MKKGFTLIELLAVIVILAIIALIATPIVLSIIEETKESAVLRSAEHYLSAVEQSVMKKNLTAGGNFSPNTCEVQSDGNLLCDGTEILEIEVNGETPSSGTITFEKGKIIAVELTQANKTITKDTNGKLVYEPSICKLINDVAPTGVSAGDKYQCKVKGNMESGWEKGYYFYVLSQESDGTTNLIMDRNINSDGILATEAVASVDPLTGEPNDIYSTVAWASWEYLEEHAPQEELNYNACLNKYGPVTAMNYLYNATKDWINIPNIQIDYEDENLGNDGQKGTTGYGGIKTTNKLTQITKKDGTVTATYENLKARMPYRSEVSDYDETNGYLYEYLHGEEQSNISGMLGYWTLSSHAYDFGYAWFVNSYGISTSLDYDDSAIMATEPYSFGVRPVINVRL